MVMIMLEVSLKSSDLLYLSLTLFEIPNPKSVVKIIIGLREHKERYYDLISELNKSGFNVIISDTRGHGKSISGNYPLGYIDDYHKLIEDEKVINDYIKSRYPGLPIYLFGDSLGAEIAQVYLQKYADTINKLVLCSPFKIGRQNQILINLTLKVEGPKKTNSSMQKQIGLDRLEDTIKDLSAREVFKNDALCNFYYTNGAIFNLVNLNKELGNKKAYLKNNLSLPIFMCYGAKDIQSGRENTQVLINILKDIGYTNITGLEYPNLFHKILFEGYHNFIYRDIINFLLK